MPVKSVKETSQGVYRTLLKFLCYNSCLPKYSYHHAQAVFTLEYKNTILGRACVDIRVCAALRRDRMSAEGGDNTQQSSNKRKQNGSGTYSSTSSAMELQPCLVPTKKIYRVRCALAWVAGTPGFLISLSFHQSMCVYVCVHP